MSMSLSLTGNTTFTKISNFFKPSVSSLMENLYQNPIKINKLHKNLTKQIFTFPKLKDFSSITYPLPSIKSRNSHPTFSSKDPNSSNYPNSSQTIAKTQLQKTYSNGNPSKTTSNTHNS